MTMGQILFIPHGGGPLPLLGDPGYARLAAALRELGAAVAGAKAIIVVTAHWEAARPRLTSAAQPQLLYDYYGFPEEAYRIKYGAPGAPALAEAVVQALAGKGIAADLDPDRGFDHGTFVPMALIRPEADIPILQMSILSSLDPALHLALGRALAPLLRDDVLLIGSGFSFHNLKALQGRVSAQEMQEGPPLAIAFHDWLDRAVCAPDLDPERRSELLLSWENAPGARFSHPREEHLLPLHVCIGAAEATGMTASRFFGEPVKGYQASGYHWR
ncbi:MAG: dioxygenase [Hyphomicrobiaceae bacterium]|nr:MAG: dioxygenase [Hyphomicrobiaceae bacterium]